METILFEAVYSSILDRLSKIRLLVIRNWLLYYKNISLVTIKVFSIPYMFLISPVVHFFEKNVIRDS